MNILLYFLPLFIADVVHGEHVDATESARGGHKTVLLEFPRLTDPARGNRRVPMKLHVPVGAGAFPVVIVSHGAGGNWDGNFAQASHLASHGYVAVCLEHVGSNTKRALAGGIRLGKTIATMTTDADEVLNRPKDVSFAIDQVVQWNRSHQTLREKLDVHRIGVMGHSFGAFTTLVVCGARPALDWLQPQVGAGRGVGPDLSDERIRCGGRLVTHKGQANLSFCRRATRQFVSRCWVFQAVETDNSTSSHCIARRASNTGRREIAICSGFPTRTICRFPIPQEAGVGAINNPRECRTAAKTCKKSRVRRPCCSSAST